jgi:hypothetical protein
MSGVKRTGALLAATLATGTLVVGGSNGPASADVRPCPGGWRWYCAQVIGIDPGSYLGIRTQPHYSSEVKWALHNGDWVAVSCWTYGDGAADNPNYNIWDYVDTGWYEGYVNDWYLDTGNVRNQRPQCGL